MTHNGLWFKLAYYSLALRKDDAATGKPAAPETSRRARPSRLFFPSRKRFLLASTCAMALLSAGASPASAADEASQAAEADDSCVKLFGWMYWTHRDEGIYRACRDGSQVKLLVPMKNVDGLAVDEQGGKLYFTISTYPQLNSDKLLRANFDGSGVEELAQGLNFTGDVVLDAKQGKLYISSLADGKIIECNLDGSERKDWLTGLGNPDEMALDAEHRNLYWVRSGKVQRSNLDAPQVEDVAALNGPAMGLALDLENKRIYYALLSDGVIRRADLAGQQDEQIVSGRSGVDGLAYDPFSRKLYWTEEGKICQSNEDGSETETLVPDKTHRFASIAIFDPKESP